MGDSPCPALYPKGDSKRVVQAGGIWHFLPYETVLKQWLDGKQVDDLSRIYKTLLIMVMIASMSFTIVSASPKWQEVADRIAAVVDRSVEVYKTGDYEGARDLVNNAYYGLYEAEGLENVLRTSVSSKDTNITEFQFYKLKRSMKNGETLDAVQREADDLKRMVYDNVKALENAHGGTGWAAFLPAFLILIREGIEAILVLAAIIAYLQRSGNERYLSAVYNWSIAAIIASFASAYLFVTVLDANTGGMSRELLEGGTALFAVVVLLATSAWIGGKADTKNWKAYIDGLVEQSVSEGTARALGFAAFLAVYREGAEVILFYQALFNNAAADVQMIWAGFGAGCVALAVIYFGMSKGVLRIPLRPFFLFTSALMFLLAVTFAGSAIKELQEGGLLPITQIENFPVQIDLLGIYPTMETIGLQLVIVLFGAGMLLRARSKRRTA